MSGSIDSQTGQNKQHDGSPIWDPLGRILPFPVPALFDTRLSAVHHQVLLFCSYQSEHSPDGWFVIRQEEMARFFGKQTRGAVSGPLNDLCRLPTIENPYLVRKKQFGDGKMQQANRYRIGFDITISAIPEEHRRAAPEPQVDPSRQLDLDLAAAAEREQPSREYPKKETAAASVNRSHTAPNPNHTAGNPGDSLGFTGEGEPPNPNHTAGNPGDSLGFTGTENPPHTPPVYLYKPPTSIPEETRSTTEEAEEGGQISQKDDLFANAITTFIKARIEFWPGAESSPRATDEQLGRQLARILDGKPVPPERVAAALRLTMMQARQRAEGLPHGISAYSNSLKTQIERMEARASGQKDAPSRERTIAIKATGSKLPDAEISTLPTWKKQLASQLSAAEFKTWITPLDLHIEGKSAFVTAPSDLTSNWVQGHYEQWVHKSICDVYPEVVSISFRTCK